MLDLGRTFLQSVERSPNAEAIIDGELRLTYSQWMVRVSSAVRCLRGMGLERGDHLVVLLQNRWEMATLHWACQFVGIIITPVNWRAKVDEVIYCAHDAQAKLLICETASRAVVADAALDCKLAFVDIDASQSGERLFCDDVLAFAEPVAEVEDFSVMLYTSGTTGRPKGVPRRHHAERAAALAHVAQNLYRRAERTLGVMPLYHTMGVRTLLAMAMLDGCYVCMRRFDARQALTLIEQERISHLYLVPTLYHDLISQACFDTHQVASVRKLGFAGAPMHKALLQRLDAAFTPELFVNHYGSSEIYTFTINQDAVRKPGSAGRAGLNARVRVVSFDAASSQDIVHPGQEGQIIADLRGDEAFRGYWHRPDADTKALRDGWYFTGDTGYFDADGELFVTGRVDDMIISGGENISPMEIESVLSLHPGVEDVAVAGLMDERWGQKVVAFVKRRPGINALVLDAHCQSSTLAGFKRPRQYVFVREIPKSPVGKILRRKLLSGEYDTE